MADLGIWIDLEAKTEVRENGSALLEELWATLHSEAAPLLQTLSMVEVGRPSQKVKN